MFKWRWELCGARPRSPPVKHTSCRLCPLAVTWSSRRKQPIRKILDQLREKLIKFSQVCLTYCTEPWDSYRRVKACTLYAFIRGTPLNPRPTPGSNDLWASWYACGRCCVPYCRCPDKGGLCNRILWHHREHENMKHSYWSLSPH